MDRIAIVTDSAASIPEELAKEAELEIVPMGVQINNKMYREGIDISKEEFYAQLDTADMVSTSQPSPGDFLEVYERVAARAKEIISIHITGESLVINVANLVKIISPFYQCNRLQNSQYGTGLCIGAGKSC